MDTKKERTISVRLELGLLEQIEQRAANYNVSRANVIRRLLEDGLEDRIGHHRGQLLANEIALGEHGVSGDIVPAVGMVGVAGENAAHFHADHRERVPLHFREGSPIRAGADGILQRLAQLGLFVVVAVCCLPRVERFVHVVHVIPIVP